jgi:hypothetical protein
MTDLSSNQPDYVVIHDEIVALLDAARLAAARSVNAVMTATYWNVGQRIVEFEQAGQHRAAYGEALIVRLSADLSRRYGRGFSRQNLQQMRQFYLAWPEQQIRQTASGESAALGNLKTVSGHALNLSVLAQAFPLPWSAYVRLLSVKKPQARAFYETEALRGGWSVLNWTVRSVASSMNAPRYRITGQRCCKRAKWPNTAIPLLLSRPLKTRSCWSS